MEQWKKKNELTEEMVQFSWGRIRIWTCLHGVCILRVSECFKKRKLQWKEGRKWRKNGWISLDRGKERVQLSEAVLSQRYNDYFYHYYYCWNTMCSSVPNSIVILLPLVLLLLLLLVFTYLLVMIRICWDYIVFGVVAIFLNGSLLPLKGQSTFFTCQSLLTIHG